MGVWNLSEDYSYPLFVAMPSTITLVAPTDEAVGVSKAPLLNWAAGSPYVAATYDIYFGTTSGALELLDDGRESTSIQIISNLIEGTTYYWRVDSTDQNETITGVEWSFTILVFAPPAPTLNSEGLPTGENTMLVVKRLIAAARNKIFYENI